MLYVWVKSRARTPIIITPEYQIFVNITLVTVLVQQARMIKKEISKKKKKKKKIRKIIPAVSLRVLPGSISSEITKLTYCAKLKLKLLLTLFSVQLNCLPNAGLLNFKLALARAKFPEIYYC